MQTNLDESTEIKHPSFWQRQFSGRQAWEQITFDVIWGIVLPVACLILDPIIFTDRFTALVCTNEPFVDDPLSPRHLAIFAYSLIGLGIFALLIWLIAQRWLGRISAIFAGIFFTGALSSLAMGVGLLPFSIYGLIVLMGICGFTPFLTSFVYLRNGILAWRMARQQEPAKPRVWLIALALTATLVVYVVPAYVQWQAWVSFPQTRIVATPRPCGPDP